jgi:hypothetical protein
MRRGEFVFWGTGFLVFCCKLRHTEGGREGIFCSFAAAIEEQIGEREK